MVLQHSSSFPLSFIFSKNDMMIIWGIVCGVHWFTLIVVSGERSNNSSGQIGGGRKRNLDDNIIEVS